MEQQDHIEQQKSAPLKEAEALAEALEATLPVIEEITGLTSENFVTLGRVTHAEDPDKQVKLETLNNQAAVLTAGRIGACLPIYYDIALSTIDQMHYRCACGTEDSMVLSSLIRKLDRPTQKTYFAPYDESEPKSRHICFHISNKLKAAYPNMYHLWTQVRASINSAAYANKKVDESCKAWFRRDLGLYHFIKDVGLPPAEGYTLKRTGDNYSRVSFSWIPPIKGGSDADTRELLARRFYSTRKQAKKLGRRIDWEHATDFINDVLAEVPTGFNVETYRIRWKDADRVGYRKTNFSWVRTTRTSKRKGSRKQQREFCNFAGFLVEPEDFALMHMRTIELVLDDEFSGGMEEAIEAVIGEYGLGGGND